MIAEIFMVRLETTARLRQEAVPTCSSHFVPFVSGSHSILWTARLIRLLRKKSRAL